jgi:hypothetical protein
MGVVSNQSIQLRFFETNMRRAANALALSTIGRLPAALTAPVF